MDPDSGSQHSPAQGTEAPLGLFVQLPLAAVMGWLMWGLDVWSGVSLDIEIYPWVIGISTGLLALPWLADRRLEHGLPPLAWLVFLALLPGMDNTALKPLLRCAFELPQGTERSEILERVHAAHEGTSFPQPTLFRDESERLMFKPNRDPGFRAECLTITLDEGRLTRVSFSAD